VAPNAGERSRSCGVVGTVSSAEDTGRSGLVSEAPRSAPLTVDTSTSGYTRQDKLPN
jgi:hypothetical protein